MYLSDIKNVRAGAVLGDTVYGERGQPLLYPGVALTDDYLADLKRRGIASIYIADPDTADLEVPQPITVQARASALQNLNRAFESVTSACEQLRQASVETILEHLQSDRFSSTVRTDSVGESLQSLAADADGFLNQLMGREVLAGLNSIKSHDSYTFQHSIDVTIMGVVLANKLGWERSRLKAFAIGCILHDIGKIFIEPEILNKPAKLSDSEFARVRAHAAMGYSVVRAIAPTLGPLVPVVAHQHHEKQDGSGYPRGLRGDNTLGHTRSGGLIHDFGAVCAVADVYDAMASARPYRAPWAPDRVTRMIQSASGTHLNRMAVRAFEMSVSPYPICTPVRVLSGRYTGHAGIVSKVYEQTLDRPRVRVMYDPAGARIEPVEIDLRREQDVTVESITSAADPHRPAAPVKIPA